MKHHFVWLFLFLSIGTGARADGLACFQSPIVASLSFDDHVVDLVIVGDVAFATTDERRLLVIDLSDPLQPVLVESVLVGGDVSGVTTDGAFLFVATRTNGLHIFDIAAPRSPRFVSVADPGDRYQSAVRRGDYLYCAGSYELIILDVSDPALPQVVGRRGFAGTGHSIALFQNLAMVSTSGWGVSIFDVTDPSQPIFVRRLSVSGDTKDIVFVDDVMILASRLGGVRTYRVSDSGITTLLDVFVTDDFSASGLHVRDGLAYVTGTASGTLLLDVSDPTDIRFLMSYRHQGSGRAADTFGGRLFVASGSGGIQVIDYRGGATPILSSLGSGAFVAGMIASGDMIYRVVSGWLGAWDLSDPTRPVSMGLVDLDAHVEGIDEDSDVVYVVTDDRELVVVDASDPMIPSITGRLSLPFAAVDVYVEGTLALAAALDRGLLLADISNPAEPTFIRRYAPNGILRTVVAENGIAFLGINDRIQIVDVRVPTAPVLLNSFLVGFSVYDLEIRDGIVAAATGYGGARVFRFDGSLELLGVYGYPGAAGEVLIHGDRLLVSDGNTGLSMYDLTDPTANMPLGSFTGLDNGSQIVATTSALVFRDGIEAVWVLDKSENCSKCGPDLNGDGVLDAADLHAFIDLMLAQSPQADMNDDGVANFFDIAIYLDGFMSGCASGE